MRFDVHESRIEANVAYLDCQADLFGGLKTRVVVPLVRPDEGSGRVTRLNPLFEVNGSELLMLTQALVALPVSALGSKIGNLERERDKIVGALDLLLTGI